MQISLLVFSVLVLCFISIVHACLIRLVADVSKKNLTRGNDKPSRRLYNKKCVCGQLTTDFERDSYVNVQVNAPGTQDVIRICAGTVIAHNLVVTSHKCLVRESRYALPYDVWSPPPKFRENIVQLSDLLVTFKVQGQTARSKVINVTYNFDYVYAVTDAVSANDIALVKVEDDLFESFPTPSSDPLRRPVCIPEIKDLSESIHHRFGYYYGFGRSPVEYDNPGKRLSNKLAIMNGEECDKELGFGSTPGVFCARSYTALPIYEGSPLITTNEAGYFQEPGTDKEGNYLPAANQTAWLVGISTVPIKRPNRKSIGYTYFANVLQNIDFIERVAKEMNSLFCETPPFKKIKKAEGAQLKLEEWPFEGEPIKPRSETLDCACGLKNSVASGRIAGGEDATPHEFGWMVKMFTSKVPGDTKFEKSKAVCGASILNDRVILTAAHCIRGDTRNESDGNRLGFDSVQVINLAIGAHYLDSKKDKDAMVVETEGIIQIAHPGYIINRENGVYSNDLALMILKKPLKFATATTQEKVKANDIRPICLPKAGKDQKIELKNGTKLTAMGWGLDNPYFEPHHFPRKLQKSNVTVRDMKFCVDTFGEVVADNVFCVYHDILSGIAQGDSGGPLVIEKQKTGKYFQVGAVSYSREINAMPHINWVAYLTDVQQHLPFIEYYSDFYGAKWCKQ